MLRDVFVLLWNHDGTSFWKLRIQTTNRIQHSQIRRETEILTRCCAKHGTPNNELNNELLRWFFSLNSWPCWVPSLLFCIDPTQPTKTEDLIGYHWFGYFMIFPFQSFQHPIRWSKNWCQVATLYSLDPRRSGPGAAVERHHHVFVGGMSLL